MVQDFVDHFRVSTFNQRRSGLGLEAQKQTNEILLTVKERVSPAPPLSNLESRMNGSCYNLVYLKIGSTQSKNEFSLIIEHFPLSFIASNALLKVP